MSDNGFDRAAFDRDWEALSNGASAHEAAAERQRQHIEDELRRLAALDSTAYERERKAIAKKLGVRASALDKLVAERRPATGSAAQGQALDLHDPEAWPEAVDGAALLDDLARTFSRFLVLPKGAATALALWTAFAHVVDSFDTAPRLAITSPTMRSGKTTLLSVLNRLVPRALLASNVSPSSVFRIIETAHPTLLIDEADTFAHDSEPFRGILNSGHTRDAAFVVRVEGDDHEPRRFSTWGAIAVAAIGKLPTTWIDRSITICLKRKTRSEVAERLTREAKAALEPLARMAVRWAADRAKGLEAADPGIPELGSDRAADNWRPLLAIADAAGGAWPKRARQAAIALSASHEGDDEGLGVLLLGDLREIFNEQHTDRLSSGDIVASLVGRDDRPWAEYRRGQPLSKTGLARLLKPFGAAPDSMRIAGTDGTAKGYLRKQFDDAFSRYLSDHPPSGRNNGTIVLRVCGNDDREAEHEDPCSASENADSPYAENECSTVPDGNRQTSTVREIEASQLLLWTVDPQDNGAIIEEIEL